MTHISSSVAGPPTYLRFLHTSGKRTFRPATMCVFPTLCFLQTSCGHTTMHYASDGTHTHTHTVTETHVDTCTHPHAAKDARDVTSTSCPPCVAHCKLCRVPSEAEDLCQSGFSCKMNSRQNPKRFVQDIIANPDPEHAASWEATKSHLQVRKPKFALLENSAGLLCPPQSLKVSNSRDGF